MKKTLLALALTAPLMASAANLLMDGSFEGGLASWNPTTSPGFVYAPLPLTYGPGAAAGEEVLPDSAASLSPDLAGLKGVWFVDDNNTQTLSQTFNVTTAGNHMAGFSVYAPANGFSNAGNASFTAMIDSNVVASSTIAAMTPTTWSALAGVYNLGLGNHTFTISFTTTGGVSKDLVIDRAYVTSAIPEPGTYGMLALGLAMVGGMVRLRRRR